MLKGLKQAVFFRRVVLVLLLSSCTESLTSNEDDPILDEEVDYLTDICFRDLDDESYLADSVNPTVDILSGGWERVENVFYQSTSAGDGFYESEPVFGHLYFEDSTVYYMTYPCQIHCLANYSLEGSHISFRNYHEYEDSVGCFGEGERSRIQFSNNLARMSISGGEYVRDKIDPATMEVLKKSVLNPECIEGTWKLVHEEYYDYGTRDTLVYPWELPETLEISKKEALSSIADRELTITVNGRGRPFFIVSVINEGTTLYLKPGLWYTDLDREYSLSVHYQSTELRSLDSEGIFLKEEIDW